MIGELAPPATLPALTLHQPWASAMSLGLKSVETRDWGSQPNVGRWLAIHAAKRVDEDEERDVVERVAAVIERRVLAGEDLQAQAEAWRALLQPHAMPRGAVLAVGLLKRCLPTRDLFPKPVEASLGNYGPGRVGWCFAPIVALEAPQPASGKQGLWRWEPEDPAALPRECWRPPRAEGPPPPAKPRQCAFDFGRPAK